MEISPPHKMQKSRAQLESLMEQLVEINFAMVEAIEAISLKVSQVTVHLPEEAAFHTIRSQLTALRLQIRD